MVVGCWHKWSKWAEDKIQMSRQSKDGDPAKLFKYVEIFQKRTCLKCGKIETESVY